VWHWVEPKPVVTVAVLADLVVVAADLVRAYRLSDGREVWKVDQRGSRLAAAPGHGVVVVAGHREILAVDAEGEERWRTDLPSPGRPTGVVVHEDEAYVTLEPDGEPIASFVDLIAVALT
jgi:outer membrane protein assembly factor BamB